MSKPTLEDRKETIIREGAAIEKKHDEVAKQRNTLNRQLSQLESRITQLQGQLQVIEDMIKERDAEKKGTPKDNKSEKTEKGK